MDHNIKHVNKTFSSASLQMIKLHLTKTSNILKLEISAFKTLCKYSLSKKPYYNCADYIVHLCFFLFLNTNI